jgi:hypothetical protein
MGRTGCGSDSTLGRRRIVVAGEPLVPPENVIDYYDMTERTMGGFKDTQDFFRLPLVSLSRTVATPGPR